MSHNSNTRVVCAPFSHSKALEDEMMDWLLSYGYSVEVFDTLRIVDSCGANRSRMLAHLSMLGVKIYSIRNETGPW